MIKETILKIENTEKMSEEKIEEVKKRLQDNIEKEKEKSKILINII